MNKYHNKNISKPAEFNETSTILDINDIDDVRKAIIASEILNRKY